MIRYRWNSQKNENIQQTRGVSFEQIVWHIEQGDLLDVIEHPNREKYPHQQILMVKVGEYAYAVPFVEEGGDRFLKTIVPSRKATKRYLEES